MFIRYYSHYFAVERQHRRLKEMLAGKIDTTAGICANLIADYSFDSDRNYSAYEDYVATRAYRLAIFRLWSRFSGNCSFPIPACSWPGECDEFHMASSVYALWDKSTVYGALRYELLNHMEHRYSLFLTHSICPMKASIVSVYQDDGFGNLKLIDFDQYVSIFLRCDHN